MGKTRIEWTKFSWNPFHGCTKISDGCKYCYAERMARRLAGRFGYPEYPHHFDVVMREDRMNEPATWKEPRMVFVGSMGDLFHEDVETWFILSIFHVMAGNSQHTFQVLTKRPERMYNILKRYEPAKNIWLGVTAENQKAADERIPILLETPAAVRFVSCEPLLGWLDPTDISLGNYRYLNALNGHISKLNKNGTGYAHERKTNHLNLVIDGGETGPNARPSHPDWFRQIRDECIKANIAYFHKHNGEWTANAEQILELDMKNPQGYKFAKVGYGGKEIWMARIGKKKAGHLLDGKEWRQMPD